MRARLNEVCGRWKSARLGTLEETALIHSADIKAEREHQTARNALAFPTDSCVPVPAELVDAAVVRWRKNVASAIVAFIERVIGQRVALGAVLRPRTHSPKRGNEHEGNVKKDADLSGYGGAHSVRGIIPEAGGREEGSKPESRYQSGDDDDDDDDSIRCPCLSLLLLLLLLLLFSAMGRRKARKQAHGQSHTDSHMYVESH